MILPSVKAYTAFLYIENRLELVQISAENRPVSSFAITEISGFMGQKRGETVI